MILCLIHNLSLRYSLIAPKSNSSAGHTVDVGRPFDKVVEELINYYHQHHVRCYWHNSSGVWVIAPNTLAKHAYNEYHQWDGQSKIDRHESDEKENSPDTEMGAEKGRVH